MPELPEVQTVVSDLNKKIKGDVVVSFWSDWAKAIKNSTLEEFKKNIKNKKILGVRRIGKNIFLDLSEGKTLYLHLKMTGHLLVKPHPNPLLSKEREQKPSPLQGESGRRRSRRSDEVNYFSDKVNQYIHHRWQLKSGKNLEFSDLRKFGKIVLDDTGKINNLKEIRALGIDAMDKKFTLAKFREILSKKPKSKIGILLMDQNVVAGIGNIYRSEILFESGIHPERVVQELNQKEIEKIYKNIRKVLLRAIELRGTSDSDYRDTSGAPGGFQKVLKVYRREKQKCKKCGTMVKRMTLGQRSVFYCLKCQK